MTNELLDNMMNDTENSENPRVITEVEKQFLLSDEQVIDRIVAGLLKDLKLL
jgi:hypothetical protein